MTPRTRIFITGIIAVVAFDAFASITSRATGTPYFWATFGSWILYIAIGYFAGRTIPESPIRMAAITGLVSGIADASLGWATSWAIGPGKVAGGITATQWLFTAVFVAALATGFAALGGVIARTRRRSMLS
jgi:hypothetical protein